VSRPDGTALGVRQYDEEDVVADDDDADDKMEDVEANVEDSFHLNEFFGSLLDSDDGDSDY